LVALASVAYLIWKYWPRHTGQASGPVVAPDNTLPPVVAAIALTFTLLVAGGTAMAGESNPVAISSASYSGTVNDRVAMLDATLHLSSTAPDGIVHLFGPDIAVREFSVRKGKARLVRNGDMISARVG